MIDETLITRENIVKKKKLYEIGFVGSELNQIINKNILKKVNKNDYLIIDLNKFKVILLNKLLTFDRTIITQEELNYFGLTEFEQKKLCAYRIIEKIDDFRFKVIGDFAKLNGSLPEIDWFLYKRLYKESLTLNDLESAYKYFKKYIEFCEILNFEGDYYYTLAMLKNEIEKSKLDSIELAEYSNSIKNYKKFINRKEYAKALTMAHKCYDINSGAMEAIRIAKVRLLLNKKDTNKILEYLQEAIRKDNINPLAYKYMAQVYLKTEDYSNCINALKKYSSLDKNTNYDYYVNLFSVYLKLNDITAAHKLFSDALLIIPQKLLTSFINECVKLIKINIAEEFRRNNSSKRLTELNCLQTSLIKEFGYGADIFKEEEQKDLKYSNLESDIALLLRPDSNNVVSLNKVDTYISNLEVNEEEKSLILLRTSLILAKSNYVDKANSYVIAVEKTHNKTDIVLKQLDETRKSLKLIKKKQ